ncbi:MAG: hypothetical protein M1820_006675 [Bogoriella megaspora]|nr:MAG: hypothetical protein M1820_006675 [Bogoriella megaspora]
MSEPQQKRPRVTPRNSTAGEVSSDDETPYSNLRQLAGVIKKPSTPLRRPSNPGTPVARIAKRTPAAISRTPGSLPHYQTTRKGPPTTPHAIRALERSRIAVPTPGGRRRSGVLQRETPRQGLRELSKLLSRNTQPVEHSPRSEPTKSKRIDDDWIDEPDVPAPRLSMPMDELEDDSFHMDPPQQSALLEDDENATSQSFEGPRRALPPQLSRGSLGSIRESARFGDLKDIGDASEIGDEIEDPTGDIWTIPRIALDGGDTIFNAENDTQEERALLEAAARRQSRPSGVFATGADESEHDPTFVFALPPLPDESIPPDNNDSAIPLIDEDIVMNEPVEEAHSSNIDADGDMEGYSDADAPVEAQVSSALRDPTLTAPVLTSKTPVKRSKPRALHVSRHGLEYPSLPPAVIKRVASSFARTSGGANSNINREALFALSQATDWFFEQASEDLASYSEHAGRKTIDESDVIALMRRQRLLNANTTPFSLAHKHLPRELLQSIRLGPSAKSRRRKRTKLDTIQEEDESLVDRS